MVAQAIEISKLEDVDAAAALMGLPVGPRTGRQRRTKRKKEWYVALAFLKQALFVQIFNPPITVRNGRPPEEPDFVVMRGEIQEPLALMEVTEATDEADQKEMTAFELSDKSAALIGEFGGRFAGGASNPGLIWAADITCAIRRKKGKVIFKNSSIARYLLVYPNSNASFLLFDEDDELQAIRNLRDEISKGPAALQQITNGCQVHVIGKYHVCIDVLGDLKILVRLPSV